MKSDTAASKRIQVLIVKYAEPEHALKALDHFYKAYLTEYQKEFNQGSTDNPMNTYKIEDGWVGYSLDGALLSIVFECPNRESAQMFMKQISHHPINLESDHGK